MDNFNVEYKAWDDVREEWIPNNLLFMDYDGQVLAGDIYNPPYVLINPSNVSFYTNLKDKHKKKIYYNSDIVTLKVWHGYESPSVSLFNHDTIDGRESILRKYTGVITRDEFGNPKLGDFHLVNLLDVDGYEFEILGDIYDNQKETD